MADIKKATVDLGPMKARAKVATFCVHIVVWLPMSWARKEAAAKWLLDWVMRADMKVSVG